MPPRGDIVVPGFVNPMTVRDIELLEAIASGKSNGKIAEELSYGRSTIGSSLNSRLYNNLRPIDFEVDPRSYCTRLYWQWKLGERNDS